MSQVLSQHILLSFDIEEFDVPCEHGVDLPMEEQIRISVEGTHAILDVLKTHGVRATFFSTANFAQRAPEVIQRLIQEGHELASHGFYHSSFEVADLKKSKDALEAQTGQTIRGYRMARMMPVSEVEVAKAGYTYNTSLNPTFIPGRYMHLGTPRAGRGITNPSLGNPLGTLPSILALLPQPTLLPLPLALPSHSSSRWLPCDLLPSVGVLRAE